MSHFYGTLYGARGKATRTGSKNSGLTAIAASWDGAISVTVSVNAAGEDCFTVVQTPWQGRGIHQVLAHGVLGKETEFLP